MRVYVDARFRALGIKFESPRAGDAGYDLYSVEQYCIAPFQRAVVDTGLHLEIPRGFVGLVKDRSSVATLGLHTLAGVIDSSYRGELKILLANLGDTEFEVRKGQKIAQLIVVPVFVEPVEYVDSLDELSSSQRGQGGFGSTGD